MKPHLLAALAFLAACTHLPAHPPVNPYEAASPEERGQFKKLMLPLPPGTGFRISQGAFGRATHRAHGYEFAWDFDVPYGTPVLAVEGGIVIQVWEPGGPGGCDSRFNDLAHNIKILASDGSVAQYVHVRSHVHLGDTVKLGQVVAETADNGFHCVPQLHFNVFRDRGHIPETGRAESIPVLFEGLPDGGMAREGLVRP